MKYAAMHSDYFYNPLTSYFMGFINMIMIMLVEIINLWNLTNITEGTYSLMFDFIALGIIAEFDDYFVEIYKDSDLDPMISGDPLTFDRTKMPKRHLPNLRETKLEKWMGKIKDNLKLFDEHCSDMNTRNKPEIVQEAGDEAYCENCCQNCYKTCWKKKNNSKWHTEAQLILSTTIIYIVEFLRLKVMLLAVEKKDEDGGGGENFQSSNVEKDDF